MSVENPIRPPVSVPRVRRQRRTVGDRVRLALAEFAGPKARFENHTESNWASITFAGTRHRVTLSFAGSEAIAAGEAMIDALPDHEFAIPGQLVAEAEVIEVDHRIAPEPFMRVTCELLLLEDA
ncbi:hypothetical protein ACXYN8_05160 [Altererythrobacter sp. CAU 1778]